jgi:uncharacterized protein Usg
MISFENSFFSLSLIEMSVSDDYYFLNPEINLIPDFFKIRFSLDGSMHDVKYNDTSLISNN